MSEQKVFVFTDKDFKAGLVSKSGKVIVSPKFKQFSKDDNTLFIEGSKKNTIYDLTNEDGKALELSMSEYWSTGNSITEGLVKVVDIPNRRSGFVNTSGELVIPCIYGDARLFNEGLCAVQKDGSWGYIDAKGTEVIPCNYNDAGDFKGGFAIVEQADKCVLIDNTGKEVIPAQYDFLMNKAKDVLSQQWNPNYIALTDVLLAKKDGKIGLIDVNGNVLIPIEADDIYYSRKIVRDDYLVVVKGDKLGAYGFDGKEYVPCQYRTVDTIRYKSKHIENVAPEFEGFRGWIVSNNKLYGVVSDGKEYIPCKYEKLQYLGENMFAYSQGELFGLIKDGTEISPAIYSEIEAISENLIRVRKEGLYGYLDLDGQEAIACQYEYSSFADGHAVVSKDGKYGVIEKSGKETVACKYVHIYNLVKAQLYTAVKEDGTQEVIDANGNILISGAKYHSMTGSSLIHVEENGLHGLINENGENILPCEYDEIDHHWVGATIKKGQLIGLLNQDGGIILPAEFDEISTNAYKEGLIVAKQGRKWLVFDAVGNPLVAPKAKKAKK